MPWLVVPQPIMEVFGLGRPVLVPWLVVLHPIMEVFDQEPPVLVPLLVVPQPIMVVFHHEYPVQVLWLVMHHTSQDITSQDITSQVNVGYLKNGHTCFSLAFFVKIMTASEFVLPMRKYASRRRKGRSWWGTEWFSTYQVRRQQLP